MVIFRDGVMAKLQDFLWKYEEGKNPRKLILKNLTSTVYWLLPVHYFSCFEAILSSLSFLGLPRTRSISTSQNLSWKIPIQSLVVLQWAPFPGRHYARWSLLTAWTFGRHDQNYARSFEVLLMVWSANDQKNKTIISFLVYFGDKTSALP